MFLQPLLKVAMAQHYGTPEGKAQLNTEFKAANGLASNSKTYNTPWAWKFNSILHDYKQSHSFE
ncbi:MAG: hypothetical protein J6T32_01410 [Paludibacteraceae bacterium]|nr:hypothetical protein [Paludibacteraceae bacterium]